MCWVQKQQHSQAQSRRQFGGTISSRKYFGRDPLLLPERPLGGPKNLTCKQCKQTCSALENEQIFEIYHSTIMCQSLIASIDQRYTCHRCSVFRMSKALDEM